MSKTTVIMFCEKCKKEPEKDEEKSNENWKVYKNSKVCPCGEKLTFKIL